MANILVIDDEELLLDLISHTLRLEGHDVTVAKDHSDALELIKQFTFDLLVCDVHIRRTSGFELHKQIIVLGNNIPILFMSGAPAVTGALAGAANQAPLLQKPFTAKELCLAVKKTLLRKTHQRGENLSKRQ